MLDEFLFKLIGSVERVLFELFHVVHFLLDRSHRVESRQRHSTNNEHNNIGFFYYYCWRRGVAFNRSVAVIVICSAR